MEILKGKILKITKTNRKNTILMLIIKNMEQNTEKITQNTFTTSISLLDPLLKPMFCALIVFLFTFYTKIPIYWLNLQLSDENLLQMFPASIS